MALLEGQVALIVGAGGGLGSAVVKRYLDEGAVVVAVDRDDERTKGLGERFPEVDCVCADLTSWEDNRDVVERAVGNHGGLDIFVSTVGVYDHGVAFDAIPGEQLGAAVAEIMAINAGSMALGVRASLEQLRARRGRVVLTASYASFDAGGGGVLYTMAKHAVTGLVRQLAHELAPEVRVNAVAPGVAQTTMFGLSALGQPPRSSVLDGTASMLPLGVFPSNDDFGGVYAFLGSADMTEAMTGEIVRVDSGLAVRGLGARS